VSFLSEKWKPTSVMGNLSGEFIYLEHLNCVICDSDNFEVIAKNKISEGLDLVSLKREYSSSSESKLTNQLVKCLNCGLQYLNPRVSVEITSTGYAEAVDQRHHEQDEYRIKTFKRALKKVEKLLRDGNFYQRNMRVLDVGCAGGAFLESARQLRINGVGLEPSRYLAEYGREKYKLKIHATTLEGFSSEKEIFSMISFWDVLEHLPNPKATLKIAHSFLEENGLLILNLPMVDTWPARLLGSKWPFYLNVHLYYFDKKSISVLLDQTGFELVGIRTFTQSLSLGYVLNRAGVRLNPRLSNALSFSTRYYMGQRTIIARRRDSD
jgi:2-polyprenyl-3-methyl-5-hydroxy-6-metoxy-1,4-benzoquinol methylase